MPQNNPWQMHEVSKKFFHHFIGSKTMVFIPVFKGAVAPLLTIEKIFRANSALRWQPLTKTLSSSFRLKRLFFVASTGDTRGDSVEVSEDGIDGWRAALSLTLETYWCHLCRRIGLVSKTTHWRRKKNKDVKDRPVHL